MRLLIIALVTLLLTCQAEARDLTPAPQPGATLPASDRVWSGADYVEAAEILTSLKGPLPQYSEEAGSKFLHRITSLENFSLCKDQRIPIKARLNEYIILYKGASSILLLYYSASLDKKQNLNSEMASLVAFTLHASALGVQLVEEFIPTMGQYADAQARQDGVKTMYSGLTTVFVGAEKMLTERNGFSDRDRSTVLEAMAETLPIVKKAFSQGYISELRARLEADKKWFKSEDDSKRIDAMLREISA